MFLFLFLEILYFFKKMTRKVIKFSQKGHGEGHGRKGKFFPRIIII